MSAEVAAAELHRSNTATPELPNGEPRATDPPKPARTTKTTAKGPRPAKPAKSSKAGKARAKPRESKVMEPAQVREEAKFQPTEQGLDKNVARRDQVYHLQTPGPNLYFTALYGFNDRQYSELITYNRMWDDASRTGRTQGPPQGPELPELVNHVKLAWLAARSIYWRYF